MWTSKQLADLEVKHATLWNRIQRWREAQLAYIPPVQCLLAQSPSTAGSVDFNASTEPAETIPLYLPSSLPQNLQLLPELSTIRKKECRLRVAQAEDALADIRRQRWIISGIWQFKKLNVDGTGNKACTRIQALYNRFSLRTQQCAGNYRAAHNALVTLDPNGSWQSHLQVLKDTDICGPGKDDNGVGNSRFEPSWIWLVPRVHSAPDMGTLEQVLDNSLHVEWLKSYARKQRWEEEVLIVQEEMCHVITYHEWRAQWWRSQAVRRSDTDAAILQGISAYAERQAHLSKRLVRQCALFWLPILKENGITPEWAEHYPVLVIPTSDECVAFSVVAASGDREIDKDDDYEALEEINDEDGLNGELEENFAFDDIELDMFETDL